MSDVFTKKTQKIRWINISDFSEGEIIKAYQGRANSLICELRATNEEELWDAFVLLNDKNVICCDDKEYDATYVSIYLRSLEGCTDRAVDFSVIRLFLSFIYNIKMFDNSNGKKQLCNKKVYICFRQKSNRLLQDYFRLSEILRLWLVQNDMYDYVRFYDETENELTSHSDKYEPRAKHFAAAKRDKSKPYTHYVSGSLCPIISVNQRVYEILDGVYNFPNERQKRIMADKLSSFSTDDRSSYYRKNTTTDDYLGSYLYAYIEKVSEKCHKIDKWVKRWNGFIKNYRPSVLVVVLFSTIVSNIIDDHNELILTDDDWAMLVERSYSYAQGILQLIENSNVHVVEKKNEENQAIGNGAFLGFRVRKDINNILKSTSNETLSQCKHFLEIIVVDCDFSDQVGIVQNYNNRLLQSCDCMEDFSAIADLQEVFDYPVVESLALKEYYAKTENIAYHYGLQIFSGVVSAANGFLSVVSGGESCDAVEMQKMQYNNQAKDYKLCEAGECLRLSNSPGAYLQNEGIRSEDNLNIVHFAGTSYTILLPAVMPESEDDSYNYFLGNIPIGVKSKRNLGLISFEQYDQLFANGKEISTKDGVEYIINIDLSKTDELKQITEGKQLTERKQIEYVCKNMLVKFINTPQAKALCFTGFKDKYALLDAVRVISLFYNKWGDFEQIKNKGIFLYCSYGQISDGKSLEYELYFNGSSLSSVFDNIQRQKLVRNIPTLFIRELETFLHRHCGDNVAENEHPNYDPDTVTDTDGPLSAAIIKYYLKPYGDSESIMQKQVKDILNGDIHEAQLGCKISKTHVRIGKVHLDTFFEAQFLFGNAYCTDIFALYVADMVEKQIQHRKNCGKKYDKIVLYGYESYSTLTLYKAQSFLDSGDKINMLVYETINERVRYLSDALSQRGDTLIIYIMGISSTLSTFGQMDAALIEACEQQGITLKNAEKLCLSIIQIDGNGSDKYLTASGQLGTPAYKSKRKYIDFAYNQEAYYFVSAQSEWYAAEDEGECCKLCIPGYDPNKQSDYDLYEERPLIEVDDTSVVPTQMIFLNQSDESPKIDYDHGLENAKKFLQNKENSKYLRYGHIERYDNHFQYFFRIAALYHDKQTINEQGGEIGIETWLTFIRKNLSTAFDTGDKTVNILIAPQHFSNIGYVNSVAKYVFGDTAHIIELDIRKEYRSNFRTKYSNYSELVKFINNKHKGYKLNFYYVNDQIITGRTFRRAESLINTLLGKSAEYKNGKVFKGVFTLIDRNSYATRSDYVLPIQDSDKEYLPFFSYLRFNIPSLRNHDNSCPLCGQNRIAEDIADCKAALTSTAHYWQEKVVYHKQRTSDQMRDIDSAWEKVESESGKGGYISYKEKKERNFMRLQCEDELWRKISALKKDKEIRDTLVSIMLEHYPEHSSQREKPIQRSFFINPEDELLQSIKNLSWKTLQALFRMIIARLCAIGSCALLNYKRLIRCLNIGNSLNPRPNESEDKKIEEYGEYLISYIKIMSRPLLFYREPVKTAVLELLLKLFNSICAVFESRITEAELSAGTLSLNNSTRKEFYDKTFNGFLLNALKRLLCYDKGYSKCNYCDRFAFEKNKKDQIVFNEYADFFMRLYIENNRKVRSGKPVGFAQNIVDYAQLCKVGTKYRIFVNDIKEISQDDNIKIAFFAETSKNKFRKLYYENIRQVVSLLLKSSSSLSHQNFEVKVLSLLLTLLNDEIPLDNENIQHEEYRSVHQLLSQLLKTQKNLQSLNDGDIRHILSELLKLFKDSQQANSENIKLLLTVFLQLLEDSQPLHEEEYYFVEGDDEIPIPYMKTEEDFYNQSDESGIYYIRIGNNYNRFDLEGEFENRIYDYRKELGLRQDAFIILGVQTTNIVTLRRILAFRKEILREAEKDFNNSVLNELLNKTFLARILTSGSYVSHNEDPRWGFIANILRVSDIRQLFIDKTFQTPQSADLQNALYNALYAAIDLYMETMIPTLYKDLVKRYVDIVQPSEDGKTVKNLPKKHERSEAFLKSDNSQNSSIDAVMAINFALDMVRFRYNDEVKFLYKKGKDEKATSLFDNSDDVNKYFKDFQFVGWFIGTIEEENRPEQYFEPFMIINTLIKNAKKYKGTNIRVIFVKNAVGGIDLIVQNEYNKNESKFGGHGMTLKALGNYFGTVTDGQESKNSPTTCFTYGPDKEEPEKTFTVTVENYCIEKPLIEKE